MHVSTDIPVMIDSVSCNFRTILFCNFHKFVFHKEVLLVLIYSIVDSNNKLCGQVHAECASHCAGCQGRGCAQWHDTWWGHWDQWTSAFAATAPRGVLRHCEEGPDQPNEQVRRLEEPSQHISALSHAQTDDKGCQVRKYSFTLYDTTNECHL